MPITGTQIRRGAYYDSVVLMQLQKALAALPDVLDAGVVMATEANKDVLRASDLLNADADAARAEDLLIAIRARDERAADAALAQIDALLTRRARVTQDEYRPKGLDAATKMLPDAQWVLISVPGKYAAGVARDALDLGKHVFLYSDNVALEDEVALKNSAREKGLLVMGPDCGTALIGGIGLGFANRVRRGRIGIVGASGTGIQAVSVGIHQRGAGISYALGTGSRDLSDAVGAVTTLQALDFLARDSATDAIVLISKPPSPNVAARVLDAARRAGKPVVVDFIGYDARAEREGNLHFARTLDDAAEIAVNLNRKDAKNAKEENRKTFAPLASLRLNGFLRGLYSGGTLAYEAQLILREYIGNVYSNAPLDAAFKLESPNVSKEHCIIDLGAEEFMVGRLHPMIDNDLRLRRLRQEADDAAVAIILLDVVLGYGAHPDPARELAPAIADAKKRGKEIFAVVIGTEDDPQNYARQIEQLRDAGARVFESHEAAARAVGQGLGELNRKARPERSERDAKSAKEKNDAGTREHGDSLRVSASPRLPVSVSESFAALNVGLESFYDSLRAQNAPAIHVDWRPPAGGNERMMEILAKLKSKQ